MLCTTHKSKRKFKLSMETELTIPSIHPLSFPSMIDSTTIHLGPQDRIRGVILDFTLSLIPSLSPNPIISAGIRLCSWSQTTESTLAALRKIKKHLLNYQVAHSVFRRAEGPTWQICRQEQCPNHPAKLSRGNLSPLTQAPKITTNSRVGNYS